VSELKPGDKVWIEDVLVEGYPAIDGLSKALWVDGHDGGKLFVREECVIPDVPNLAAVARVLAAHPGIGEAVARIAKKPSGEIMRTSEGDQFAHLHQRDADLVLLGLLAAALGGTA